MKLSLIKLLAVGIGTVLLTLFVSLLAGLGLDAIGVHSALIKGFVGIMIGLNLPGPVISYVLKEELAELKSVKPEE